MNTTTTSNWTFTSTTWYKAVQNGKYYYYKTVLLDNAQKILDDYVAGNWDCEM